MEFSRFLKAKNLELPVLNTTTAECIEHCKMKFFFKYKLGIVPNNRVRDEDEVDANLMHIILANRVLHQPHKAALLECSQYLEDYISEWLGTKSKLTVEEMRNAVAQKLATILAMSELLMETQEWKDIENNYVAEAIEQRAKVTLEVDRFTLARHGKFTQRVKIGGKIGIILRKKSDDTIWYLDHRIIKTHMVHKQAANVNDIKVWVNRELCKVATKKYPKGFLFFTLYRPDFTQGEEAYSSFKTKIREWNEEHKISFSELEMPEKMPEDIQSRLSMCYFCLRPIRGSRHLYTKSAPDRCYVDGKYCDYFPLCTNEVKDYDKIISQHYRFKEND